MKFKKNHGFTLTELLIAVAIVGILAAIAVPRYLNQEAARAGEAVTQLSAISVGERSYRISNGTYLNCSTEADWATIAVDNPNAGQTFFDYDVRSADNTNFCIVATRNDRPSPTDHRTICIDEHGQYSGTHPNSPNPNGTGNEQDANTPNTCVVNVAACHA